jgi:hypothetical protein
MIFGLRNPIAACSSALALFGVATVVSTAAPARAFFVPNAVTMDYGCITNTSATNCQTGQNQFKTRVSMYNPSQGSNPNQVLFEFFNLGNLASSITDVYFQDTAPKSLAGIARIFNSSGTSFSEGATPPNLPGGNPVGFVANFSADSNSRRPGVKANGVDNVGESLGVLFNLKPGFSNPMFTAILADLKSGSLRVGIHAQGFSDGGSESFVNKAVPEPLTILGTGAAIGMGALMKRRQTAQQKKAKAEVS